MIKNYINISIFLICLSIFSTKEVKSQASITYDPTTKFGMYEGFGTFSEIYQFHTVHYLDSAMFKGTYNLSSFCPSMYGSLEDVNDNTDPNVANFAALTLSGDKNGSTGYPPANYFVKLKEYKKTALARGDNFEIRFRDGYYDRWLPQFLKVTDAATGEINPNMYDEYAEYIYMMSKVYSDALEVDCGIIPVVSMHRKDDKSLANGISPQRIKALVIAIGKKLEREKIQPRLILTNYFDLGETSNRDAIKSFYSNISAVMSDPNSAKYVKYLWIQDGMAYQTLREFDFKAIGDTCSKYNLKLMVHYGAGLLDSKTLMDWNRGMNVFNSFFNISSSKRDFYVSAEYLNNFENWGAGALMFDAGSQGNNMDDPNGRKFWQPTYFHRALQAVNKPLRAYSSKQIGSKSDNADLRTLAFTDSVKNQVILMVLNTTANKLSFKVNTTGTGLPTTFNVSSCGSTYDLKPRGSKMLYDTINIEPKSFVVLTGKSTLPTGIETQVKNGTFYPNPLIQGSDAVLENKEGNLFEIMDISGRTLMEGKIDANTFKLPTASLIKGVYYLHVHSAEASQVFKVMVN